MSNLIHDLNDNYINEFIYKNNVFNGLKSLYSLALDIINHKNDKINSIHNLL